MTENEGLAHKLAAVDEWVAGEFAFVRDALVGLGCGSRPESGPGLVFDLAGRAVVRVHPKRRHLAVGFPETLQQDVDALNRVPRTQRGSAWLNYSPGVCDRDTLEALIARAAQEASSAPARPSGPARQRGPAVRDDDADLTLLLSVLRAYKLHEQETGRPQGSKVLREALFFVWDFPRLPPGGKYSPELPHSPAARAHQAAGRKGGLVHEHVRPVNLLIRELLTEVPADTARLRDALDSAADRAVITRAEDLALSAAGVAASLPDPTDPWGRYNAIGLSAADFAPVRPPAVP